jgi:5'-nucleotidase
MRILCTNDDGIHAPGLKIVEEIAARLSDDVWIVAPELDQSGVSHSLVAERSLRCAKSVRAISRCGARRPIA